MAGGLFLLAVVPGEAAGAQPLDDPARPTHPTGPGGLAGLTDRVTGSLADRATAPLWDVVDLQVDRASAAVLRTVAEAAAWLLGAVARLLGAFVDGAAGVDLRATWWVGQYNRMLALAMLVAAAALLTALTNAAARGSLEHLVQAVLVDVPVAAVAGGVGPVLVQFLVAVADEVGAAAAGTMPTDAGAVLVSVGRWLTQTAPAAPEIPVLVLLLLLLGALLAGLLLVLELVLRANAIYLLAALLAVGYAMRVWPGGRGVARKLTAVLAVVIVAKPIIVFTLALATARLTPLAQAPPPPGLVPAPGAAAAEVAGYATLGQATGAVALLLLAAFAPWGILALLPAMETGLGAAGRLRGSVSAGPRAALQGAYTAGYLGQLVGGRLRGGRAGPPTTPSTGGAAAGTATKTAPTGAGSAQAVAGSGPAAGAVLAAQGAAAAARGGHRAAQAAATRQQQLAQIANPPAGRAEALPTWSTVPPPPMAPPVPPSPAAPPPLASRPRGARQAKEPR